MKRTMNEYEKSINGAVNAVSEIHWLMITFSYDGLVRGEISDNRSNLIEHPSDWMICKQSDSQTCRACLSFDFQ